MKLAAIAYFCYKRPIHTARTLQSLSRNDLADKSDLYIYCDGPKNIEDEQLVKKVHLVIKNIRGFKNIYIKKFRKNQGCRKAIIFGLKHTIKQNSKIIVVEDDVDTHTSFLRFMNDALKKYEDEETVFSVTGFAYPQLDLKKYSYDAFFYPRTCSYGWGSWKSRIDKIDWGLDDSLEIFHSKKMQKDFNKGGEDLYEMLLMQKSGKIDTWDISFTLSAFMNYGKTLYPTRSLINNIGFDGSGTHVKADNKYKNTLNFSYSKQSFRYPPPHFLMEKSKLYNQVFSIFKKNKLKQLLKKIKRKISSPNESTVN